MNKKKFNFSYEEYHSIEELKEEDAKLLSKARKTAETAYAPYSNFFVGAAALLQNGKILTGTNQENASYPVTICAERSLLSSAAAMFPKQSINVMAISYHNHNPNTESIKPLSPCGMCRQALVETEKRYHQPIKLILGGLNGKILIIESAADLLPFTFTGDDLK
ncbi:MAG: cytidine deaminase [Chitinophagaceae bacterium]